jgi:Calcineurin-like phosphoesterase
MRIVCLLLFLSNAVSTPLKADNDKEDSFEDYLADHTPSDMGVSLNSFARETRERTETGSKALNGDKKQGGGGNTVPSVWDTTLSAFSEDLQAPPLKIMTPDQSLVTADIQVYTAEVFGPTGVFGVQGLGTVTSNTTLPATNTTLPKSTVTTFYAIGDVPYNNQQAVRLVTQLQTLPADAEFVIHVGDIRYAGSGAKCTLAEYQAVANILLNSPAPVLIVPGDNEYNDCPNMQEAWGYWMQTFPPMMANSKWVYPFTLIRHGTRPENFYFIYKGVMYFGLNIPGGRVQSKTEWSNRLTDLKNWVIELTKVNKLPVALFAQAYPSKNHAAFFKDLVTYFKALKPQIPLLYLHGDYH